MATVKYNDLEMAMEMVSSSGGGIEFLGYISRQTGQVYCATENNEFGDDEDEFPPDVYDPDLYAGVPDKRDLNLGKRLVLRFSAEYLSEEDFEKVKSMFRRKGAYSRYKDLLDRKGKLDEWYEFEQSAVKRELIEWAEMEGFVVEEDSSG